MTVGARKAAATTRSPRRPENRFAIARMIPMTATNNKIASNIVTNLWDVVTAVPSPEPDEGSGAPYGAPDPSVPRFVTCDDLLRPGRLDLVDRVLRALTGDPVRGLLPEGVGTDGRRHRVGAVE